MKKLYKSRLGALVFPGLVLLFVFALTRSHSPQKKSDFKRPQKIYSQDSLNRPKAKR